MYKRQDQKRAAEEDPSDWYEDAAFLPAWAVEDYVSLARSGAAAIQTWNMVGTGEDGGPVYQLCSESDKPATRGEIVEFLSSVLQYVPCYPTGTAIEWGFDREMPVVDGSTSSYPYTEAIYRTFFINSRNHPVSYTHLTLKLTFKAATTPEDFLLDKNREFYVLPTHLMGDDPAGTMELDLWKEMCIRDRPYTFSSIVLSSDGKMAYQDNPSGPLVAKNNFLDPDGSLGDFWVLNVLRSYADGIIVGANTLRCV